MLGLGARLMSGTGDLRGDVDEKIALVAVPETGWEQV
jgi:hypothetical protein